MLVGFLLLVFLMTCIKGLDCPDNWIGHGNSCYLFSTDKKPWAAASLFCAGHRATLAKVDTAEESTFIRGYLKIFDDLGADTSAWIGGNDLEEEGIWTWSPSGANATFTDWFHGEPGGDGDCLVIFKGHDYHWGDGPCSKLFCIVCEKQ